MFWLLVLVFNSMFAGHAIVNGHYGYATLHIVAGFAGALLMLKGEER